MNSNPSLPTGKAHNGFSNHHPGPTTTEQHFSRPSPKGNRSLIRAWDPRTRLLLTVTTVLTAGLADPLEYPTATMAVIGGLVAWATVDGLSAKFMVRRGLLIASMFLSLFLVVPFAPEGQQAITAVRAATFALKGWLFSMSFVIFSQRTSSFAVLACLARWGFPRSVIIFLAIEARHLASLRDEAQLVLRTLALRGSGRGGLRSRLENGRIAAIRTLPAAVLRAERIADALVLRGWEGRLLDPGPWRPNRGEANALMLVALSALVGGLLGTLL